MFVCCSGLVTLCCVQIREYHRKHPAARVVDANDESEAILKEEPPIEFSGEVCNQQFPGEHGNVESDACLFFFCEMLLG